MKTGRAASQAAVGSHCAEETACRIARIALLGDIIGGHAAHIALLGDIIGGDAARIAFPRARYLLVNLLVAVILAEFSKQSEEQSAASAEAAPAPRALRHAIVTRRAAPRRCTLPTPLSDIVTSSRPPSAAPHLST